MKLKELFKKKNKKTEQELEFTNSSTSSFESSSFTEEDFQRKSEDLNQQEQQVLTEDIERPITLNTNLTPNINDGKIEELSEEEMMALYRNDNGEEKLEEMFAGEENFKQDKDLNDLSFIGDNNKTIESHKFTKKKMPFKSKAIIFGATLGIGVIGIISSFSLEEYAKEVESDAIKSTFGVLVKTKGINASFKSVLMGDISAEEGMTKDWDAASSDLTKLAKALQELNNSQLSQLFAKVEPDIRFLGEAVTFSKKYKDLAVNNEKTKQDLKKFEEESSLIVREFMSAYSKNKATNEEMAVLFKLKELLVDLSIRSTALLQASNIDNNLKSFNSDKDNIKNLILSLAEGDKNNNIRPVFPETILTYNNLATQWNNIVPTLDGLSKNAEDLTKADNYKTKVDLAVKNISDNLLTMSENFNGYSHQQINLIYAVFYAGFLIILASILGLVVSYKQEIRRREQELIDESNRSKESILKLLNEMSYLQNGDLTKKTTIEEGITLNIADSINATIDSLAVIVRKIQNSSSTMKDKTREIEQASEGLLYSAENQTNSILEAKDSITNMSRTINDISEKTKLINTTSEQASNTAMSGMSNVQNSIEAMEVINKDMTETVQLMNNMVKSSQEISEVIELLSDITEETNILALNASVQAAKAGEDGKGFKIVADAIHELANNAATATKKVSSLISNVQSEIKHVEKSLEKTTLGVQAGAKLSESVGESLVQITDVSFLLNETIKKVAEEVSMSAIMASQITKNMESISNVTEETRQSARSTTKAISEIESISSELSSSVKSFIC